MAIINKASKFAKIMGLRVGDDVVEMGGYPFQDILDYLYYDNESKFDIKVIRNNEEKIIHIRKPEDRTLGLEFDLEMKPKVCKNHCIFCFVDQLPKGLRDTLYVKDDDYRFSFISGSYITMTNLTDDDIDRIIRLKLSPLYVSVHAFDDDVRVKLLRNPNTKKLIPYMKKLGNAGIKMHTQLVVIPGINDGAVLEQSIRGLSKIPGVVSVAVVPVGLTEHRAELLKLQPVTKENALETIKLVERLHCELDGICWCADEYYVKAGIDVNDYTYYGSFDQIENGVGLLADFKDNLEYSIETSTKENLNKSVGFITGTSFKPILEEEIKAVEKQIGIKADINGIINNFFGKSVTVAGLVTAGDIVDQIKGKKYDLICLPDNMLREFTDMFLDNITIENLEKKIETPILVLSHDGQDFVQNIIDYFKNEK